MKNNVKTYTDENIDYKDLVRTKDRTDITDEHILKPVIGIHGNIIEINYNGTEVYTIERISLKTNKIIPRRRKITFISTGYPAINIKGYGPAHIHRLVCWAWNGPPTSKNMVCRHLDDDRHISSIKRRECRKYLDTDIESENYGKK